MPDCTTDFSSLCHSVVFDESIAKIISFAIFVNTLAIIIFQQHPKTMNSLGERIRQLRQKHKLSQQDFAKNLEVSQSFLSDVERDLKMPGGDFLLSLKRSFNVSIDWLLAGELEIHTEGASVRTTGNGNISGATIEKHRVKLLEKKVEELEREVLTLTGQVTAYKQIIETFKRR